MTPRPIFLVCLVVKSISSMGYLLTSMTLSRKCTAFFTVFSTFFQSNSQDLPFFFSILVRLIEPKLQLS